MQAAWEAWPRYDVNEDIYMYPLYMYLHICCISTHVLIMTCLCAMTSYIQNQQCVACSVFVTSCNMYDKHCTDGIYNIFTHSTTVVTHAGCSDLETVSIIYSVYIIIQRIVKVGCLSTQLCVPYTGNSTLVNSQ